MNKNSNITSSFFFVYFACFDTFALSDIAYAVRAKVFPLVIAIYDIFKVVEIYTFHFATNASFDHAFAK